MQIKKIPDTFNTIKEYFDAFLLPLLEEVRAELCSKLSKMSGAPFANVLSCRRIVRETHSHLYRVKIDHWRTRFSGENNTCCVFPGDVFVLLESNSENAPELQSGQKCVLVTAVKLLNDDSNDGNSSTCIKVRASHEIDLDFWRHDFLMVSLTNIIQFERIWNALHKRENLKLLEKVLNRSSLVCF